jgi:hypothetical protein
VDSIITSNGIISSEKLIQKQSKIHNVEPIEVKYNISMRRAKEIIEESEKDSLRLKKKIVRDRRKKEKLIFNSDEDGLSLFERRFKSLTEH